MSRQRVAVHRRTCWRIAMVAALALTALQSRASGQSRCVERIRSASGELQAVVVPRVQALFEAPSFGVLDSVTGSWARQFRSGEAYRSARTADPTIGLDSLTRNLGPAVVHDTAFLSDAAYVL